MKRTFVFLSAALLFMGPASCPCVRAQSAPPMPPGQASEPEAEQMDFAQGLLARGMYDMAQAEYQKFLDTYPQSLRREEAYLGLAETRFMAKDFPKAQELFTNFKQSYPQSTQLPTVLLRLGQMDIERKDFEQAAKELGSIDALKLKPDMAQAFAFYLGEACRGKGDLAGALNYFQQAAGVADSTVHTVAALQAVAEIQVQNSHYKEAAEAYAKALPLVQEGDVKGYLIYRLGEAQFLAGDYTGAIAQFQQVLDQYAKLDITKDALTNLLLARFNMGQYDYLLAVYKNNAALIKEGPEYFDVHFSVAKAYFQLKQYDQALALIDKVLSWQGLSDDQKQKATVTKAEVLVKQAKYQEGLSLLKDNPSQPGGDGDEKDFVRAQTSYGLGDFQKAAELFGDIINNHPDSSYAKAALLGRAHALQESGDFAQAAEFFLKYYEHEAGDRAVNPKGPLHGGEALYLAALMEVRANAVDHAIVLAQKYLQEFPQGPYREQTILLLANLYAASHQSDKSIALLQEFLAHPENIQDQPAVYFLLGYNQQVSGQNDQALQTYAKVAKDKDAKFYASALKNSAAIYLQQNHPEQAAAVYEQLISELDNKGLELKTYLWLCNEYLKEKKFKGVLRIADKAQESFPDQSPQELAYFKAEASRALQDFGPAAKLYDEAVGSDQKGTYSGAAHIGKGLNFMAVGQFPEAQKEFEKAVDENADDLAITLRARFEMANALMGQQKPQEALRFYLLVATIYDDGRYCPQAMFKAAGILESLGRKPEAAQLYQEILDKYKDSSQASSARERLTLFTGPLK